MTVQATTDRIEHTGDGTQATYSYPFRVLDEDHLVLLERDSAGSVTTLVKSTDYTVDPTTIGLNSGGSITLTANLANGHRLLIKRVVPGLQETDIINAGTFDARVVEDSLDLGTMLALMLFALLRPDDPTVARALLLGDFDTPGSGAFDAQGNRIGNIATPLNADDVATKQYVDDNAGGGGGGGLTLGEVQQEVEVGSLPTATQSSAPILLLDDGSTLIKRKTASGYEYAALLGQRLL